MFTRLFFCVLAFLSISTAVHSQWSWVDSSVGNNFERVTDLAVDDVRNVVYSVGYLKDTPSFPEINGSSLSGGEDGFIMKYDTAGTVLWAFAIGGTSNDRVNAVAVDEITGNIFVTGFTEGSNASNSTSLKGVTGGVSGDVSGALGDQDAFIASYNESGQLIWYEIVGGTDVDRGMDIDVNSSGVFMNGFYTNTATLSSITSIIPTNGKINNFVIALNKLNGNSLWDAALGSASDDYDIPSVDYEMGRMGISADVNGVFLVSYFRGDNYNVYNGYDALVSTIADVNSSTDNFVVTSYANNGNHNWSVLYDNVGSVVEGLDITNDCSGVYVSGAVHDGGVTPGGTVINSNHDDFFLSKLDKATSNEIWVTEFNSNFNHDDYFVGIDTDGYGNLYAVGRLRGTSVSSGASLNVTGRPAFSEIIIAHLHTDGVLQGFDIIPGSTYSWGMSVATYKNEKYVVGGYYNNSVTFGTITPNSNLDNGFVAMRDLQDPISYVSVSGSATFCQSEANPVAINNAPSGGTLVGPPQVTFLNTTTGEIDLTASTVGGPYTISYTGAPLMCGTSADFEIYILSDDDASFVFEDDHFCENQSNPLPTSITTPGGTFVASTGLVLANSLTGEIDVMASTVGGPYKLYYTTSGGACTGIDSLEVYIDSAPDPTFTYAQPDYCSGLGAVVPNSIIETGGSFTGPAEIVFINSTTGEIDINASTVGGPYTIQYLVSNSYCQDSATFNLSILLEDDASFTYSVSHFCKNESNPIPTSVATAGGTFSGPSDLVFANTSTGEIDVAASTVGGPYYLVYTTNGVDCPASDSIQVYIEDAPDASFAYSQTSFCSGVGTILPSSIVEPGGTFTGPAEIVFVNATTGEIDLSASTVGGPYTIQYNVSNAYCQDSETVDLTIDQSDDASFVLASNIFCSNGMNPVPTSITTPGGVFSGSADLVFTNTSTGEIDLANSSVGGPYYVVYTTNGVSCPSSDSIAINIEETPDASFAYSQAAYCSEASTTVSPSSIVEQGGVFTGPAEVIFVNTTTGEIDLGTSTPGGPYEIQYSVSNTNCQESSTFNLTINPTDDASFTYPSDHFCKDEPNPIPSSIVTTGGIFSGSPGLILNNVTGEIDVNASTAGGPYYVVYNTNGAPCPASDSIQVYIEVAQDPSFSYEQSTYCGGGGSIIPNSIALAGGTFSGPAEIVFVNTATGEIDISASTVGGPYAIEYLLTNAYCQKSTTFQITIISQDVITSVEYSTDKYCTSDGNQIPEVIGTTNGVFTGPSSIDLVNATTGEFSPSTSVTGGPYLMKYVTLGACPDSTEISISIYDLVSAYAGEDQRLYFVLTSTLDAEIPIDGSGVWSADSALQIDDYVNPYSKVSNLSAGVNTFTWTVSNDVCPKVSDDVVIIVEDLYIPQALTPNGDGKNDFFELHSLDEVTCSLQIFNRWGQIVYQNDDYQNEWNGQNESGNELKNDTYFYVILIDDSVSYNGYVVLKK